MKKTYVGKLFVFMGIGVLLRKRGIIPPEGKKLLTDLVINLILPCSIISSFLVDLTTERLQQTGVIFLISIVIQLVSYLAGHIVYRKCSAPHRLLWRQTGTKPAIPNVLYMYPLAAINKGESEN